jgi:signal transduction histidine kinase/ketosteroid isomerase-like protein
MEFIPLKKRAIGSAHIIPMEFIPLKKRAIGSAHIIPMEFIPLKKRAIGSAHIIPMEFIPLEKKARGSAHIMPMEFIPLKKRAIGATPIIMKATKKIETKILKIYDKWLHSYLNGDVATYDSYLDDEYHFIGSATKEEFLNRKDTTQFFANTGDQFAGKTELRNETKTLEHFGELIFITHVFDGWFLHEKEWNFYSRFRFSSILRKNKDGWRFIYQHFSIPDAKTNDGETIGYDKINEENLELREAIQRRTVELESKNRELEVEGALERIRAQAVAMKQSSDLLDIVVTMRTEFIKLGHEAHYFWHMMWLPETYEKAMTSGDGTKIGFVMELPRHIHGDIPLLAKWEKSKKPIVVYAMDTEAALAYVDKMVTLGDFQNIDPQAPSEDDIRHIGGLTFIMARTTHGEIGYSLPGVVKKPPKEDLDILEKFAGAFDLAHRRFLDLQKAEKQAREVEIELALEKVRSRTMGMQRSEELKEVILEVNKKLQDLGISMVQRATAILTFEDGNKDYKQWVASPEYNSIISFLTPYIDHPIQNDIWNARQNGIEFYAKNYSAEEKNSLFNYLFNLPALKDMPEEEKIRALQFKYYDISIAFKRNAAILVVSHSGVPLSEAENTIVKRLAKVFEQTYTRFLDLQKAEAQARESGIELALERVRARTMAMQHSDELQEASFLLDEQVRGLGIKTWGCAFNIYGDKESTEWFGNEAGVLPTYTVPRTGIFKKYYDKGQKGETLWIEEFSGKACVAHYETMSALPVIGAVLLQLKKTNKGYPTYQLDHVVYFKYGYLLFITQEHVPEAHDIFKRFAKVFEQTYTRFLDLQKAEAQARESEIELALERVRASTMAMQHSDELSDASTDVFKQIQLLGIHSWSFGFNIFSNNHKTITQWVSSGDGRPIRPFETPATEDVFSQFTDAAIRGDSFYVAESGGEELAATYKYMSSLPGVDELMQELKETGIELPTFQVFNLAFFKQGYLMFITDEQVPQAQSIFKRFAKVFEQTYTRFLDLQKAEAQTREAQIEAALEKVRSRSMAMHTSEELLDVITVVSEQLQHLEFKFIHVSFANNDLGLDYKFWTASKGGPKPMRFNVPYLDLAVFNNLRNAQEKSLSFCTDILSKKEHNQWHKHLLKHAESNVFSKKDNEFIMSRGMARSIAINPNILLILANFASIPYSQEENKIIERFGQVFDQAYTRFLDLEKAEAQTREAQIEAALEKIRSSSLAMHKTDDLGDVVSVLFEQLQRLDVDMDFGSVSIFVFQEDSRDLTQWIQLPEEVVPISVPYFEHPILSDFFDAKEQNKDYFEKVYTVEEKNSWAEMGFEFTDYKNLPAAFKTSVMEAPGYAMSIALKKNSGICIPSFVGKLPPKENIDIMKRVSMVFEQAYIRFLDLKKAELQAQQATENLKIIKGARAKAEKALKELKSAQSQLIQSEKMASLGELTAGIAHEIQNPLNFVNNFSEVSKELLEEMLEEIENGDMEEVKAIMADVIQNLEKINHHGKRADGIVKGMLQHSRSSTGKKEPTDINALADEYLRLAYHGLRAKDKSFNAELVTDFDDSIGNISVIPQDLGRVILNLITNAFYAVNEKAKSDIEGYQPTVTVSSKRTPLLGGAGGGSQVVKIAISDNGNGIPKDIVDKIFQPFFTTKPTGQGTGLGLSMSYDIVTKGHGGELQVETKEGEKTKFIIILPA